MALARLPVEVVSSLRSAFLVTSFASCLEELVQNSLDAGATQIDISLDLSTWSCRVTDNGVGIPAHEIVHVAKRYCVLSQDLPLFVRAHHSQDTSKCSTLANLHHVATYGFRGEALASLAEAGMLEVVSRHVNSDETFSTLLRGGQRIYAGPARSRSRPTTGTVVYVRDLFYKWPVKRKQMATDFKMIMADARNHIELIALVHPTVTFTCTDGTRSTKDGCVMRVRASDGNILARWRALWGGGLVKVQMVPWLPVAAGLSVPQDIDWIDESWPELQIDGFLSAEASHNKDRQLIYLNRRLLAIGPLHSAINSRYINSTFARHGELAARSALAAPTQGKKRRHEAAEISPRKKSALHPVYLLILQLDGRDVELISQPSKHALVLKDEGLIARHLAGLADRFLVSRGWAEAVQRPARPASEAKSQDVSPVPQVKRTRRALQPIAQSACCDEVAMENTVSTTIFVDRSTLRREGAANIRMPVWIQEYMEDWRNPVFPMAPRDVPMIKLDAEQSPTSPLMTVLEGQRISREAFVNALFIAQYDRKFLLCRVGDLVILVDQHAADERIRVERILDGLLCRDTIETRPIDQHILLMFEEARQVAQCIEEFKFWGISLSLDCYPAQATDYVQARVHTVPAVIYERCSEEPRLLAELVKQHLAGIRHGRIVRNTRLKRHLADCPSVLLELVNSRACRSSIMFNDVLQPEQSARLIAQLAETMFPFSCAHGRPSMLPLADLSNNSEAWDEPVDWTQMNN